MNKKIVVISILLISSVFFTSFSAQAITFEDENSPIIIDIKDAYYCNADNGLEENDIVVNFDLYVKATYILYFELYFRLILPSGNSYIYGYGVLTIEDYLNGRFYFYNHATESGWYTVEIVGIIYQQPIAIGVDSYSFDPPGETEGSEPLGNHLQFG